MPKLINVNGYILQATEESTTALLSAVKTPSVTLNPGTDISEDHFSSLGLAYDIPDNKVKCAKPATHTQRLWTREYAESQGLEQLFDFNYVHKNHQRRIGKFVPAPFFDLTVASEEAEKERKSEMVYFPSCRTCVKHPFKDETIRVFDSIRNGTDPSSVIQNDFLTRKILEFLTNPLEGYAEKTEGGIYMPLHKHNPFS